MSDRWERSCACDHPLREHKLDWERPDDGITPDCTHPGCDCMDFEFPPPPSSGQCT